MLNIGTTLQGRYLIEERIGEGGMGTVYSAIDQRFENKVAIKETFFAYDEFGEAFEREARLLNSLHHPVLPHVSDFFTEDGKHFLVMEFIEGKDLSEILESGVSLPAEDVLKWANQLLDALDFLHSQNPPIIHCDIKPHNLKITPRGDIILLDFGLAKLEKPHLNGVRSVIGYSRTYSPLEQIEGTGTDARSDIFSLGATGYHLLTGYPPVDVLRRASEIIKGRPDPLEPATVYQPEINPVLAQILHKSLALNPDERYASALEMQSAIDAEFNINSGAKSKDSPSRSLATQKFTVTDDGEIIEVPEVVETDFPALVAFANDPAHNTQAIIDHTSAIDDGKSMVTELASSSAVAAEPFSVTMIDGEPPAMYKRLVPALLVLFLLGGGVLFWAMSGQTEVAGKSDIDVVGKPDVADNSKEVSEPRNMPPASLPIAPQTESSISKTENSEAEIVGNEVKETKASETRPARESKLAAFNPTAPKVIVKSAVPVAENNKKSVATDADKPKALESRFKEQVSAEQLKKSVVIEVKPSSGLTRPRIAPKSPAASRRQSSSVSEINRFFTGDKPRE